jgi:hypothetical protein
MLWVQLVEVVQSHERLLPHSLLGMAQPLNNQRQNCTGQMSNQQADMLTTRGYRLRPQDATILGQNTTAHTESSNVTIGLIKRY